MSTVNVNRVVDASGGVLAPISSVMRNRIINGAMTIAQRGTTAITADGFPVDRFIVVNGTDGAFSAQQDSSAPAGFINSIKCTITTVDSSLASTQAISLQHRIEGYNVADLGWGTANAKTITVSFWVRSSLTGTFGGSVINNAFNRSYPFSYTITSADTWEQKSVTIAGDTTGTWLKDSGRGLILVFSLGAGSDRVGTAGAWSGTNTQGVTGQTQVIGTSGATWYVTGVQLEVGTQATSFEYRQYTTELQLCQRYLPAFGTGNNNLRLPCSGICASASLVYITVNFPVTTRVPPTGISISSASHFTVNVDGLVSSVPTALAFTAPSSTNANRINASGLSGLTTGQPAFLDITNTSGQLLFTGCEL
jgi:hypothetical protein